MAEHRQRRSWPVSGAGADKQLRAPGYWARNLPCRIAATTPPKPNVAWLIRLGDHTQCNIPRPPGSLSLRGQKDARVNYKASSDDAAAQPLACSPATAAMTNQSAWLSVAVATPTSSSRAVPTQPTPRRARLALRPVRQRGPRWRGIPRLRPTRPPYQPSCRLDHVRRRTAWPSRRSWRN